MIINTVYATKEKISGASYATILYISNTHSYFKIFDTFPYSFLNLFVRATHSFIAMNCCVLAITVVLCQCNNAELFSCTVLYSIHLKLMYVLSLFPTAHLEYTNRISTSNSISSSIMRISLLWQEKLCMHQGSGCKVF